MKQLENDAKATMNLMERSSDAKAPRCDSGGDDDGWGDGVNSIRLEERYLSKWWEQKAEVYVKIYSKFKTSFNIYLQRYRCVSYLNFAVLHRLLHVR
jgi:hypothetical protein